MKYRLSLWAYVKSRNPRNTICKYEIPVTVHETTENIIFGTAWESFYAAITELDKARRSKASSWQDGQSMQTAINKAYKLAN